MADEKPIKQQDNMQIKLIEVIKKFDQLIK